MDRNNGILQNSFMLRIIRTLVALALLLPASSMALPEIPFCPFGGAPGWFNRLFDDDPPRYPPPWVYQPMPPVQYPHARWQPPFAAPHADPMALPATVRQSW
jgi:hypothetical protein